LADQGGKCHTFAAGTQWLGSQTRIWSLCMYGMSMVRQV